PDPADRLGTRAFALKSQGWGTPLLPAIEQNALFTRYNPTQFFNADAAHGSQNQAVVATPLTVMQCPSTPVKNRVYTADSSYTASLNGVLPPPGLPVTPWTAAAADYGPAANVSVNFQTIAGVPTDPGPPTPPKYLGALARNNRTPLVTISDGTSATVLTAEFAGRPMVYRRGQLVEQSVGTAASPLTDVYGGGWGDPNSGGFTLVGSDATGTVPGPCVINCANDARDVLSGATGHGFYGFHAGGANFAFCDGGVRFLADNISPKTMIALVSKTAGDIPGTDF
ncbi:MAG: DUF1559 domain-containing protein, partial [Fimbriiglobus sp.]